MRENSERKNELNEQELEQITGGNAGVHTIKFRFYCTKCGNVRIFTNTIGSITCDCGATMQPVDSFTT